MVKWILIEMNKNVVECDTNEVVDPIKNVILWTIEEAI